MTATAQAEWARRLIRQEQVFTALPEGWRHCHGSSAPRGYAWINNGESIFSGRYRHALLKIA